MSTQALKLAIFHFVRDTNDDELLHRFYETMQHLAGKKTPPTIQFSANGQPISTGEYEILIEEALHEIEEGSLISHSDMKKKLIEKYQLTF